MSASPNVTPPRLPQAILARNFVDCSVNVSRVTACENMGGRTEDLVIRRDDVHDSGGGPRCAGELAGTATGYAFAVHGFACLVCCLEAC